MYISFFVCVSGNNLCCAFNQNVYAIWVGLFWVEALAHLELEQNCRHAERDELLRLVGEEFAEKWQLLHEFGQLYSFEWHPLVQGLRNHLYDVHCLWLHSSQRCSYYISNEKEIIIFTNVFLSNGFNLSIFEELTKIGYNWDKRVNNSNEIFRTIKISHI